MNQSAGQLNSESSGGRDRYVFDSDPECAINRLVEERRDWPPVDRPVDQTRNSQKAA